MTSLGYQTLTDMTTDVGQAINDSSSGRAIRIKDILRRRYAELVDAHDWPQLIRVDETGLRKLNNTDLNFLESGEGQAVLPRDVRRVLGMTLQARGQTLDQIDAEELYERLGTNLNTTGTPQYWAYVGRTAQYDAIDTQGKITVTSNSTNSGKTLQIIYSRTTGLVGDRVFEDLSGDFSAGIQPDNAMETGYPIESISLPSGWQSGLSVTDAGSKEIIAIPPFEEPATASNARIDLATRPLIRVGPVPAQDEKVTVTYIRDPVSLTEDLDKPEIPVSPILIAYAIGESLNTMARQPEAPVWFAQAERQLARLVAKERTGARKTMRPRPGNVLWQTGLSISRPGTR